MENESNDSTGAPAPMLAPIRATDVPAALPAPIRDIPDTTSVPAAIPAAIREVPDNLSASLDVFKGDDSVSRRQRHTEAEIDKLPFLLSQGFVVLQAVIHRHLQRSLQREYTVEEASALVVKIKPSTVAAQNRFVALNESNFEEFVRRSFFQALVRQHQTPEEARIPLFVYISSATRSRARASRPGNIRRATQERIREATTEITAAVEQNAVAVDANSRIGEISTRVWALTRARDPNPSPIVSAPANNTFRQAARLDFLATQPQVQSEWAELPLRLNQSERVTVEVHIPTLRSILGLPPSPLFENGIFHNDPLPTQVGVDMEDEDHQSDST